MRHLKKLGFDSVVLQGVVGGPFEARRARRYEHRGRQRGGQQAADFHLAEGKHLLINLK